MSKLEGMFAQQVQAAGLPAPEREYRFDPARRWRFDFAWRNHPHVTRPLAVEIEGGTWLSKSRHTTGAGFEGDCEKYNAAAIDGWTVLRFTGGMVESGKALEMTKQALGLTA